MGRHCEHPERNEVESKDTKQSPRKGAGDCFVAFFDCAAKGCRFAPTAPRNDVLPFFFPAFQRFLQQILEQSE